MTREYIKDTLRVFVVPVDILDREDLTTHEKMVYVVLRSYANPNTLQAFPSYSTIAKKASISKSKAIRTIQSLVDKGILIKKKRFTITESKNIIRDSNEYEFADLRPGVVSDVHQGGVHGTLGVVSDVHQGGVHGTLGVVSDVHQGGVHGTPYIDLDQDKDKDKDLDQIDPELRKHIEKLGLAKHAKDIVDVYAKRKVTKKVFLEVLERVAEAEKKGKVRSIKGYLIRSLKNEAGKRNEGLPESMTSPPAQEISEEEAKAKLELAERLLKQLYPTGEK